MTIPELLRSQDGLITRRQALDAGLTKKAIEIKVAQGDWQRVRPAVFLSAEHALTARARVRADMLWLGPDATLIGEAAAWWWRMTEEPPSTIRIALPAGRRGRRRADLVVECRDLDEAERVVVDGVTVTPRATTIVDVTRRCSVTAGAELMDRMLLGGRVTLDGLRAAHRRALGRQGLQTVATLLRLAAGGARFAAERRLHRLLRRHLVDGWVADHPVTLAGYGVALLDIAFVEQRVAIEVDGWAYHRELAAFRRDPRRQNAMVLAGWTVLRFTWHDLATDPERVLTEIRAALRSDRPEVTVRPLRGA